MILNLLSVLLTCVSVYSYTKMAELDQIKDLPGSKDLNLTFNHFSGYIPVGESKQIHYWFVESMKNPSSDPLTFWTNGGPGCSGLIGFLTEQGPFKPNKEMNLELNPYAWNQISNMVFVEIPAGVGYSYSDNKSDYTTGDDQTAEDNYHMIQGFLKKFPEYKTNDLYITSESYGGHYMPTLAKYIVDENTKNKENQLNLKGFAVGNPYTNFYTGVPSGLVTDWGHQLISKPTWDKYSSLCLTLKKYKNIEECETLMLKMYAEKGKDINPYALDYPVCKSDNKLAKGRAQRTWLIDYLTNEYSTHFKNALNADITVYEPCEDDYARNYLNLPKVKEAIHVKKDIEWEECSHKVNYSIKDKDSSMVDHYNYLIDGNYNLNILVYSGDDDSVCSTEGTQSWIWDLGYEISKRNWETYTYEKQTAGYFTAWKNTKLGFLTIRGAGHEVPTYKPEIALDMFTKYINGDWTSKLKN